MSAFEVSISAAELAGLRPDLFAGTEEAEDWLRESYARWESVDVMLCGSDTVIGKGSCKASESRNRTQVPLHFDLFIRVKLNEDYTGSLFDLRLPTLEIKASELEGVRLFRTEAARLTWSQTQHS